MNTRVQLLCLWCGPVAMLIFFVGFWPIAGLVPPPSPDASSKAIQHLYQQNTDMIRLGLLIAMFGGILTGPFAAAISVQMKRVEGRYSPLAYTNLGLGMIGILIFLLPMMMMETAAFHPHRDPELIHLVNDMAWIPFVGTFFPAFLQNIAIAICVFQDHSERVFPRWVGYFNAWAALAFVTDAFIFFFKTGPFAWNGLLAWWLVAVVFSIWVGVMFVVLRRSILRHGEDDAARSWEPEPARSVGMSAP